MKKLSISILLFCSFIMTSSNAYAAFTLNTTRVVYSQGDKGQNLVVKNNSDRKYGGQVWIESFDKKIDDSSYVVTPSLFAVEKGKKQQLRIMQTASMLPTDKESLFWIYVQELPPALEEGNKLQFAMRTKIKLISRPKVLNEERAGAESKLELNIKGNQIELVNPTPYFFAISTLSYAEKEMKDKEALSIIKPKSTVLFKNQNNYKKGQEIIITYVDDFGAYNKIKIRAK
ncbi:TPA: fimbrial biogenesis chaperone [Photobacterium damselae]